MDNNLFQKRFPELEVFVNEIKDAIAHTQRPPEEVIIDEVDFRNLLKISKRTAASLREKGLITYSKVVGKIYYKLSDVIAMIDSGKIEAVTSKIRIN